MLFHPPDRFTWYGASGVPYEFEVRPIPVLLPALAGVYVLCRQDLKVLYVGKATSLRERLNQDLEAHDGFDRAAGMGLSHIGWTLVNPRYLFTAESDLGRALRPPCNKQWAVHDLGDALADLMLPPRA